jgi:predicted phosphodiesterase
VGAPPLTHLRRALTLLAVLVATLAGGYGALATFAQTKQLSVGEIRLSVSPGHRGALDVYVPLVDWGARFEAIRLPARLRVDLRTVDRRTVQQVARAGALDVARVRTQARDAIAEFIVALIGVTMLGALSLGLLVAFAIRGGAGPRLRWTAGLAVGTTVAIGIALVVLFPPRGEIDHPQYYAHGADIPRALDAIDTAQRSTRVLNEELDAQLVGLARLVTEPAGRDSLDGAPRLTVASDLHNNALTIPILERVAGGGPVLFPGDMTDRGSPLEFQVVRRVVRSGDPFVFVSGNHDSNTLERDLARAGATVLTEDGQLNADGTFGEIVVERAGVRIAGYGDPFERRSTENYADRYQPTPTPEMQDAFTAWMRSIQSRVDVIMVHEPALIKPALDILHDDPPSHPLMFVVGHTHKAKLDTQPGVTVVNGGSIGGGGTGNLAEEATTDVGVARVIYASDPAFRPLAVDLVSIDPSSGSATARRDRLDE